MLHLKLYLLHYLLFFLFVALLNRLLTRTKFCLDQVLVRTESSAYDFTCLMTERIFHGLASDPVYFKHRFSSMAHLAQCHRTQYYCNTTSDPAGRASPVGGRSILGCFYSGMS